jgi:phosphoglycerate dehydrogenase-like enzyme
MSVSTRTQTIHAYFPWADALRDRLRTRLPDRELVIWTREEEFVAGLPEVEVLFVMRPPRGHWARASRLRFIQTIGAGVDSVLPAPDLPERVLIANARGLHADHMSEFAVALLLALAQRLTRVLEQQREHRWRPFVRETLEGRTLGILGLGAIGEAVARKARALGMRVIGTRRSGEPSPHADRIYPPSGTDEVLGQSDAVVVLLPLTPETRGLLDRQRLSRMREGAFLVDLARGEIVDEEALAESLKQGHLGGAALDVFAEEPLSAESPLWDTPNLLVTPHMAGLIGDYLDRALEIFFENLGRLERGEPLRNEVDRERGY